MAVAEPEKPGSRPNPQYGGSMDPIIISPGSAVPINKSEFDQWAQTIEERIRAIEDTITQLEAYHAGESDECIVVG